MQIFQFVGKCPEIFVCVCKFFVGKVHVALLGSVQSERKFFSLLGSGVVV